MLSVLLEAAVRATLIALTIALLLLAMRVKQTALRHAVWTVVMAAMLFLPLSIACGPRTTVPLLAPEAWQSATLTRTAIETAALPQASTVRTTPPADAPQPRLDWSLYAAVVYFAGFGVLLVRLMIGT